MLSKDSEIKELLQSISESITRIDGDELATVNEVAVIEKLRAVDSLLKETLRYKRPAELPEELPWSSTPADVDLEFNPLVFDGSMSIEDHERATEQLLGQEQTEIISDVVSQFEKRIDENESWKEPQRSIRLGQFMTELEQRFSIQQLLPNEHVNPEIMHLYLKISDLRNFD